MNWKHLLWIVPVSVAAGAVGLYFFATKEPKKDEKKPAKEKEG